MALLWDSVKDAEAQVGLNPCKHPRRILLSFKRNQHGWGILLCHTSSVPSCTMINPPKIFTNISPSGSLCTNQIYSGKKFQNVCRFKVWAKTSCKWRAQIKESAAQKKSLFQILHKAKILQLPWQWLMRSVKLPRAGRTLDSINHFCISSKLHFSWLDLQCYIKSRLWWNGWKRRVKYITPRLMFG